MDMEKLENDIDDIKTDISLIRKVLMGEGESNPHGGLVGKVIKIDTKQKIIIAILGAIAVGLMGLAFGVVQYLIADALIHLP